MMKNCPRCGFSQPEDQYCARCGVDMISYRPVQKPFLDRLVRSTGFQIIALIFIVVVVFSFARQQRRRELLERNAEIENAGTTQVVVRRDRDAKSEFSSSAPGAGQAKSAATATPTEASTSGFVAGNQPSAPPANAAPGAAPSSTSAAVSAGTNDDTKSGGTAARAPTNVHVTFASVPRAIAEDFVASADRRASSLSGTFNIGVVHGLSAKIRAAQSAGIWEQLDSSSRSIKVSETVEFYGGQHDQATGQYLGFVVEAVPTQLDENESHLRVRISRYLREKGQQDEFAVPMPDSGLNIPRGAGAFVSGNYLLPRRNLTADDRRLYDPIKVLHIYATEEFARGLSELVILIEPR